MVFLQQAKGSWRSCQPPTHPPGPRLLQRSLPVFCQTLTHPGILGAEQQNCSNNLCQLLVQRCSWQ